MKISELNHIALEVADVARSVAFYEKLGLEQKQRPAFDFEGAWFKLGEFQELHLIGGRSKPVNSAKKGSHYALRVASLQEVRAHLQAVDVPYLGPVTRPDGASQVFISDPDGYYIEFCQLD